MTATIKTLVFMRFTLAILWILTAWASIFGDYQFGLDTLNTAGIAGRVADLLINSGAGLDLIIGIWVLTGRLALWCYRVQMLTVVGYTLLLSYMAPEFWLHPFGPLSKNLPIIALLLIGYQTEKAKR
ncbi:MAG: NAD-dependent dehydratase [Thalassolituus sp.]|nr:MAG: NAD-dependent dehydratase [Thalassolituus sp.]